MGSVLDSFNQSPLGAYIQSPLGERGGGKSLYVCGVYRDIGNLVYPPPNFDKVVKWSGSIFSTIGVPPFGIVPIISSGRDIIKFTGDLIIGGSQIIKRTGAGVFSILGTTGIAGFFNRVNNLVIFNDVLYLIGSFLTADGIPTSMIASWNGSIYTPLLGGLTSGGFVEGYRMQVFDGKLWAVGNFEFAGPLTVKDVAQWDGTNWSKTGVGAFHPGGSEVRVIQEYKGDLIVGGIFTTMDGIPCFGSAKWNGTVWSNINPESDNFTQIHAMGVHKDDLYMAGIGIQSTVPAFSIAKFNGTTWTYYITDGRVDALESFNGQLYAGGTFDVVNGVPAKGIARFNGTVWSEVSTGIVDPFGSVLGLRSI
jgi:hypothetical protein